MEHTIEDIRIAKQSVEGSIINLLEDFIDKYNLMDVELNLLPIRMLGSNTRYDVEITVKI